jgi:hypothetical protein
VEGAETMKDWRCLLMIHNFTPQKSPDGRDVYLECRRCGKYKEVSGTNSEMLWSQNPYSS